MESECKLSDNLFGMKILNLVEIEGHSRTVETNESVNNERV